MIKGLPQSRVPKEKMQWRKATEPIPDHLFTTKKLLGKEVLGVHKPQSYRYPPEERRPAPKQV